jgi:beta-lactamase superfamily II metal-dependent hydrolase
MEANRLNRPYLLCAVAILTNHLCLSQQIGKPLPPWTPGTLDIHQIQTGRGNSAYLIFPDGVTLLIDAGAVPNKPGPELGPQRPNATQTPGEWIARYIEQFSPTQPARLDYALITHHHDDHMGAIETVARRIPIHTLLNREDLEAGRNNQIGRPTATFEVRNIAANGDIWSGESTNAKSAFPAGWKSLPAAERPTENELSAALRIHYGRFTYFTGGDLPGIPLDNLPEWHDLETPVARAVGPVDVLVLNHHGWLDTTNTFFLQTLQPRVIVIPAWHATHPDHGVLRRILSTRIYPGPRDIFATTLLEAPRTVFSYLGNPFKSTEGHIVVRVAPGGDTYQVFILDDTSEHPTIMALHGPYDSKR